MLHLSSVLYSIILCSLCISSNHTYVYSADIATVFEKVVHMCHRKSYNVSLFDCLKERSLIGLDSIYRSRNDISLIPNFLSLVPNDNYSIEERTGKNLLMDIESQSPQNRSQMLDNLIAGRAFDFLASRSVSIKVPFATFDVFGLLSDSDNQTEGRGGGGKKDKGGGLLAMGAMMAGTMMAMKMAAIAAMAGKALMASLMALMLAALASLGKKSGGHSSYEVINVPPHGHHGRRSMQEQQQQHQHYSEEYYNVTPAADEYELPAQ